MVVRPFWALSHPPNFIMAITLTLLENYSIAQDSALMSTLTGSCQINAVRSWQSHMLLFVEVTATKSSKNQWIWLEALSVTNIMQKLRCILTHFPVHEKLENTHGLSQAKHRFANPPFGYPVVSSGFRRICDKVVPVGGKMERNSIASTYQRMSACRCTSLRCFSRQSLLYIYVSYIAQNTLQLLYSVPGLGDAIDDKN
ncbi:hypothetical protein T06_7155 [Trichinella sp. T6]|nr:hypothetical protein T06_7155 [Trichinella sp. T6]